MNNPYQTIIKRGEVWRKKRIIREIYLQWFSLIRRYLVQGTTVELGAGIGMGKDFIEKCIETDIVFLPWLDTVLDAHSLPFKAQSISNIICIDVLHHLRRPALFFLESERALREGGRLILLEPYVSPLSYMIYRIFHNEAICLNDDPLREEGVKIVDNQAVSNLIFFRYQKQFKIKFPKLKIIVKRIQDLFIYPLSGGFKGISFLCPPMLRHLKRIEDILHPLRRILGFRVFIVLERCM